MSLRAQDVPPEIAQNALLDRLLVIVKSRWRSILAIEEPEGVPVHQIRWRGREADLNGVQVGEHIPPLVVDGAVRLVRDYHIKLGRRDHVLPSCPSCCRSPGRSEWWRRTAWRSYRNYRKDLGLRFFWEEFLESVVARLIPKRFSVRQEQNLLRFGLQEHIDDGHSHPGLSRACAMTTRALPISLCICSITRLAHSMLFQAINDLLSIFTRPSLFVLSTWNLSAPDLSGKKNPFTIRGL